MRTPVPFKIAVPQSVLDRIRERVADFDWRGFPDLERPGSGISKDVMRAMAGHLVDRFDWRAQEARLNQLPQFTADVDGQRLHFVHVRGAAMSGSSRPPILLIHGWPGSFVEFEAAAERLAFPQRFGGRQEDALDLVIPSLPGYGFSGSPDEPIGPKRTAALFDRLMRDVLGYSRYVAQGGDWGSTVCAWLGHGHAPACTAIHLNLVLIHAADAGLQGDQEIEHAAFQTRMQEEEGGYAHIQRTRPQTLGFALHDSPIGTAAWILEKFGAWSDLPRGPDGADLLAGYDIDHLLTNVMIYLVTNSIVTSTWFYQGLVREGARVFPASGRVNVPTAIAAYRDPVFPVPPRSRVERSYDVVRWTDMPQGGHFAAMERPDTFADDVRAFVLSLG